MGDQRYSLRWDQYQSHLVNAFENLRGDHDFVDVTLGVGGKKLMAHKMLLSACSPYFRDLLKGNPCQHPIILLRDIPCPDMEALLQFMYHGQVSVEQDQLESLLRSAQYLSISGLAEQQEEESSDKIHPSSNIPPEGSPATETAQKRKHIKRPASSEAETSSDVRSKQHVMKKARKSDTKDRMDVKQEVIEVVDVPEEDKDTGRGGGGHGEERREEEAAGEAEGEVYQDQGDYTEEDYQGDSYDQGDWNSYSQNVNSTSSNLPLSIQNSLTTTQFTYKPLHYCDTCNRGFSSAGAWYNHKKFHTGETLCKVCNKTLGTVSSLNRHIKYEHPQSLDANLKHGQ